jgi:hypothetical protein
VSKTCSCLFLKHVQKRNFQTSLFDPCLKWFIFCRDLVEKLPFHYNLNNKYYLISIVLNSSDRPHKNYSIMRSMYKCNEAVTYMNHGVAIVKSEMPLLGLSEFPFSYKRVTNWQNLSLSFPQSSPSYTNFTKHAWASWTTVSICITF